MIRSWRHRPAARCNVVVIGHPPCSPSWSDRSIASDLPPAAVSPLSTVTVRTELNRADAAGRSKGTPLPGPCVAGAVSMLADHAIRTAFLLTEVSECVLAPGGE